MGTYFKCIWSWPPIVHTIKRGEWAAFFQSTGNLHPKDIASGCEPDACTIILWTRDSQMGAQVCPTMHYKVAGLRAGWFYKCSGTQLFSQATFGIRALMLFNIFSILWTPALAMLFSLLPHPLCPPTDRHIPNPSRPLAINIITTQLPSCFQ